VVRHHAQDRRERDPDAGGSMKPEGLNLLGKVGFWTAKDKLGAGIVSRVKLSEFTKTTWKLKKLKAKLWRLEMWHEINGAPAVPDEECVEFKATDFAEARQKADKWREEFYKLNAPKSEIAMPEGLKLESLERAVMLLHKDRWPNLFSLKEGETDQGLIRDAVDADLHLLGFEPSVEHLSKRLVKMLSAKKVAPASKLRLWIFENWICGEKLFDKEPLQREEIAKKSGHAVTEKSLAVAISRLGLTNTKGGQ
jgi:hypothetical protein